MRIDGRTSLVEVATAVCTALEQAGVTAVLTGGSAATFHAPEAYQSSDIDVVAVSFARPRTRADWMHSGSSGNASTTCDHFSQKRENLYRPSGDWPSMHHAIAQTGAREKGETDAEASTPPGHEPIWV